MSYRLNPEVWGSVFAVPSAIVEKHIKLCSGVSLKLLLLILCSPNIKSDEKTLGNILNLSPSDVSDALNYWVESGILISEFNNTVHLSNTNNVNPQKLSPAQNKPKQSVVPPHTDHPANASRRAYTRDELVSIVQANRILSALVDEGQAVMGKVFTSADLDCLVALFSFYSLSAHFILTVMHYCVSIGKKSMGYAESVAVTWMNDGIDDETIDCHVDKMLQKRSFEGKVRAAFGMDRALVAREREMIERWLFVFNFEMDMILLAYEISVERIGKLAFRYIDKILENWYQQGIKTPKQAKSEQRPETVPDPLGSKILEKFMRQ